MSLISKKSIKYKHLKNISSKLFFLDDRDMSIIQTRLAFELTLRTFQLSSNSISPFLPVVDVS